MIDAEKDFAYTYAMKRPHISLLKTLAQNIKKRRKELGYSQEQLAESVRISRNYLAGIETFRDSPSLGILPRLAKALKVSVSELFREQEEKPLTRAERISIMLSGLSDDDAEFLENAISEWVTQLHKKG